MRADWKNLARETRRSFDPDEVLGMWSVDWRKAREAFFEDHRAEIEAEPRRFRRGILKANAVVYGLTRRLAPPRRLVFAGALVLAVLSVLEHSAGDRESGFAFLGLLVAVLALDFPSRDGARGQAPLQGRARHGACAPGAARPAAAARDRVLRARGREPRREHGGRRPLRVRAAPRRTRRGPLRRRLRPRHGGGPRDGRDPRGLPDAARRSIRRPPRWRFPSTASCARRELAVVLRGDLRAPRGGRILHGDRRGSPARPEARRGRPGPRAHGDGVVSSRHQEEHRVGAADDGPRARRDAALPLGRAAGSPRRRRRRIRRRPRRVRRGPEGGAGPGELVGAPDGGPRPLPRALTPIDDDVSLAAVRRKRT